MYHALHSDCHLAAQNSELYLGPHPATFEYGGKTYNQLLKPGETQHFYFSKDDPPPFYDLEAPREDTPTGKTNRKGVSAACAHLSPAHPPSLGPSHRPPAPPARRPLCPPPAPLHRLPAPHPCWSPALTTQGRSSRQRHRCCQPCVRGSTEWSGHLDPLVAVGARAVGASPRPSSSSASVGGVTRYQPPAQPRTPSACCARGRASSQLHSLVAALACRFLCR